MAAYAAPLVVACLVLLLMKGVAVETHPRHGAAPHVTAQYCFGADAPIKRDRVCDDAQCCIGRLEREPVPDIDAPRLEDIQPQASTVICRSAGSWRRVYRAPRRALARASAPRAPPLS